MKGFAVLAVMIGLVLTAAAMVVLTQQSGYFSAETRLMQERAELTNLLNTARTHAEWELQSKGCMDYAAFSMTGASGDYSGSFGTAMGSPVDLTLSASLPSGLSRSVLLSRHPSYDGVETNVFYPVEESYIEEKNPDKNHDSHKDLHIGLLDPERNRGLMRFDLSSLPPNAVVEKATLRLFPKDQGDGNETLTVHRVTKSWVSAEVTWNERSSGSNWNVVGGDFSDTVEASFPVGDTVWVDVDLTDLVQAWHRGSYPNYGVLFQVPGVQGSKVVKLETDPGAAELAYLEVETKCECGGTCSVNAFVTCDANYRANTKLGEFPTIASSTVTGAATVPPNIELMGVTFPVEGGYVLVNGDGLDAYSATGIQLGSCTTDINDPIEGLTYAINGAHQEKLVALVDDTEPTLAVLGADCTVESSIAVPASGLVGIRGVAFIESASAAEYENHFAIVDTDGDVRIVDETGAIAHSITPSVAGSDVSGLAHVYNEPKLLMLNRGPKEVYRVAFDGTVEDRYDYTRFGAASPGALAVDFQACYHVLPGQTDDSVVLVRREELSADPIAHWKLDEASGFVAEDIAGNHDAVVPLSAVWMPAAGAVQGALEIDSSLDETSPVEASDFNLTGSLTVAGWINTAGPPVFGPKYNTVISRHSGISAHNYRLGLNDMKPLLTLYNGVDVNVSYDQQLNVNEWYHLVGVYDADTQTASLYVNGLLVQSEAVAGPLLATPGDLNIGSSSGTGEANGPVDDVMIFDAALTANDVALLFAEARPGTPGTVPGAGGGSPSLSCGSPDTYEDDFEYVWSWGGSTGSLSWSGNWSEIGDNGSVFSGDVEKASHLSSRSARLFSNNNALERGVDLSVFTEAQVDFKYTRAEMDYNDTVALVVENSGGAVELEVFTGEFFNKTDAAWVNFTVALPDTHLTADATVRFVTDSTLIDSEGLYIDDFVIEGCPP